MSVRRRLPIGVSLFALAIMLSASAAQEPVSVRTFLDPRGEVAVNQSVQFVIQIDGAQNQKVIPPSLNGLVNLMVVSGPQTSTSMSLINGRRSSNYRLIYTLLPEGTGVAQIPALDVVVDGRTYRTRPMRVKVSPATQGAEAVFLQAELGSEEVWVGQPVPLSVTLYTVPRASGANWRQTPDFANFWVESVEYDDSNYRTRIGGQVYQAYPLERKVLIPPGPGEFELQPYVAQVQVRVSRNDAFDWFSMGRTETVICKSQPLTLRVQPLPTAGRPADFNGAVGSYSLRVEFDRDEARVDDAVALRATVRGEGALMSVGPPVLDAPPDLKVFDPQVKESNVRTVDGKITSRKTWEWIVVPLTPGRIQLPEMRFEFFDPASETYRAATGEPLLLAVTKGDGRLDRPILGGGIQVQRRELAFIKPLRGRLREETPRVHRRAGFVALLTLPLVLVPLVVVVGRQRARLRRDLGLARARRARARARKRLQVAKRRLADMPSSTFHEEVARTLVEYIADRTNRSAAGLTYDAADELLVARGLDSDLRRQFRACLETCDFARFVPTASQADRRTEVLEQAFQLVERLERAW